MTNTIKDYTDAYKRLNWAYSMVDKMEELDEDTQRDIYDIISQYEDDGIVNIWCFQRSGRLPV